MKMSSIFSKEDIENAKTKTSSWTKHLTCFPTKCDTAKSAEVTSDRDTSCQTEESTCCFPATESKDAVGELVEMAIKALRSNRLLLHEQGNTSSILEEETAKCYQFRDCEALAIDSEDPYWDFRNSMEEMVEAYGLKRWDHLEELLALYLRMNMKKNHGVIVVAFMDCFAAISTSSSCSNYVASSSSESKRLVADRG